MHMIFFMVSRRNHEISLGLRLFNALNPYQELGFACFIRKQVKIKKIPKIP